MITLLVFALSGCDSNNKSTEGETNIVNDNYIDEANITELNNSSYMGMELNQDSGLSEEESKEYGKDYPYVMYPEDGDTKYYCFKYPNDEFPLTVTQIEIKDSEYNVFGISIGDDVDVSEGILQEKGYEKKEYSVKNTNKYSKGDVQILLQYKEKTIERIVVSLKIVTEKGVKY